MTTTIGQLSRRHPGTAAIVEQAVDERGSGSLDGGLMREAARGAGEGR